MLWVILSAVLVFEAGMTTATAPPLNFKLRSNLPPPLTGDVPGTWAFDTMSRRIHQDILPRIIEDNTEELTKPTSSLRSECLLVLRDLQSSLECGTTGVLRGVFDGGPDIDTWNEILYSIPEDSRNWLNAPWIITEFYFYRRIVEAFRFFETGYDMFVKPKFEGLLDSLQLVDQVAAQLESLLAAGDSRTAFEVAVATSLWGNKMDLSIWPTNKNKETTTTATTATISTSPQQQQESGQIAHGSRLDAIRTYILDDDMEQVVNLLDALQRQGRNGNTREISIVVDNAGYELVTDLILGHTLLQLGAVDLVTFHTKAHPTFVSDATNEDVYGTVDMLAHSPSVSPSTTSLGKHFESYIQSGQFVLKEDLFWCQPTAMWDMPPAVQRKIATSRLVFVKGDANYRRLLGERMWPMDTNAADILSYWPVPVCALRTFKAEIGCGISPANQQRAQAEDPNWLVSGRWGVVQLGGDGSSMH
mmetsp:Transcript_3447/g.5373  ORF Transcript_3447/g.5373 Transcript_3447/m.5373 type:complete len:475 (-) Transcript_3447:659-2083(-)